MKKFIYPSFICLIISFCLFIYIGPFHYYYGLLNNGCVAWGMNYNYTYHKLPNTTKTSTNGPNTMSIFLDIYNTYEQVTFICFMPNPGGSNISIDSNTNLIYIIAISTGLVGLILLLISILIVTCKYTAPVPEEINLLNINEPK